MTLPNSATYPTYGGEKADYSPVADPTTDLSAAQLNEARSDVAAMTRMIPRAYVAFSYATGVVTVADNDSVWGNATPPTVARTATGTFLITWPASIVDARGNTQTVNLRRGDGNVEAANYSVSAVYTSPNSFTAYVSNGATISDPPVSTIVTATVY